MVKFLSKFRRGGGDEPDTGAPVASVPALEPGPGPGPGPEPVVQEAGIAPEPPTESSFVESSFDADPVDAPVTQPPPTFEVKKGKKDKGIHVKAPKFPRFRKKSEPKAKEKQEPMELKAPREKPVEYRHKKDEHFDEARQEQIAMDTFQYRIHQSRASGYSQYGTLKAPGFDYLNWRPYGYPRYPHSNPESYLQQIHALVPYVYDVVVSGCQGVEERRWDALTKSADEHAESAAASRDISAMGSRTQSRDRLVS